MHWIFGEKLVHLGDSCTVGGEPAMNIPVLNASELHEGMDTRLGCAWLL